MNKTLGLFPSPLHPLARRPLYEIYPLTFKDSNHDGIGDLDGIRQTLPDLNDLGIGSIWLTPIFRSPFKDGGYDISDFKQINPSIGNFTSFSQFIIDAHHYQMKVFLDGVFNHTSNQHPWFQTARRAKKNPYRDWYIWANPQKNGQPPTNWQSVFGGSAWEYDQKTNQYYLHRFLKEQPDLNWTNPAVAQAIQKIISFWSHKGVDGFRLDSTNFLMAKIELVNETVNPLFDPQKMTAYYQFIHEGISKDQSEALQVLHSMLTSVSENTHFILEAYPDQRGLAALPTYQKYIQSVNSQTTSVFNFELLFIPWQSQKIGKYIYRYLHLLNNTHLPIFVLGNHDQPRLATRIGNNQLRAAAMLQLTLPGLICIYNGEELGLHDSHSIPKNKAKDLFNSDQIITTPPSRDPQRAPYLHNNQKNGGFSEASPDEIWLPINKNDLKLSRQNQVKDESSLYHLYKKLIHLRAKEYPVLYQGSFQLLNLNEPKVLAFLRSNKKEILLILLNFTHHQKEVKLPYKHLNLILSTHRQSIEYNSDQKVLLIPDEGLILKVCS